MVKKPFMPEVHPEYEAFYNGLTEFDKEEFKRFRRSHPTLTNQEAMSMFKLNYGHSRHMGISHGLYPQTTEISISNLGGY